MAKKTPVSIYLSAFLVFAAGLGFLVFSAVDQGGSYFLNVGEALAAEPTKLERARLFGKVAAEDIQRPASALGVHFTLRDKMDPAKTLRVEYAGVVPDTFKPGVEVIVEGSLARAGVFGANSLMTKCPSKYETMSEEMDAQAQTSQTPQLSQAPRTS